mgnify:CR=1 FL=1
MVSVPEHYHLNVCPFERNVAMEGIFISEATKENVGRILSAARADEFAAVIGAPGTGKSTLLRLANSMLPKDQFVVIYNSASNLNPRKMYREILTKLGCSNVSFLAAREETKKRITEIREVEHKHVMVIFDEAHLMSNDALQEVRFLLNDNFDSCSLMSVILAGQSELWNVKLFQNELVSIRQRLDILVTVSPMDRADTDRYINYRLKFAGQQNDILTEKAIGTVYTATNGIPRLVNRLCGKSLLYGAQMGKKVLDEHDIKYVMDHETIC